ncbi:MAG: hypothetical protein K8H88_25620 [Sandaracinaceae bacterium]|nr:hypothetical protein [Sandaracinaceae bacterium]
MTRAPHSGPQALLCALALLSVAPALAQQADEAVAEEALEEGLQAIDDLGEPGLDEPGLDEPGLDEPAAERTEPSEAAEPVPTAVHAPEPHEEGVAAHEEGAAHEGHGAGADTHSGEHASHATDWTEVLATVVNFLLLCAILVFLARKPLTEYLRARRLQIEEGLVEAARLKEEAERKHAEYSERLEQMDEELERMRKEMVQAGEAERDRIIAEAEARAARMRREAQFVIDQRVKQLRADLTREAIEAAVGAAEALLRDATTPQDQKQLADSYLAQLERSFREDGPEARS